MRTPLCFHRDTGTGFPSSEPDSILLEILADGSVKITTDPISPANHAAAEGMLRTIAELLGGITERVRRRILRLPHKVHVKQRA